MGSFLSVLLLFCQLFSTQLGYNDGTTGETRKLKEKGPAITILVSNDTRDVANLKQALLSLDKFMTQDNWSTPVLLFNEGNIGEEQITLIVNASRRKLYFPRVDFGRFPDGFNPLTATGNWKKRSKWGYQQMCRFWSSRVWEHESLDNYSTIMRFDTDSCFVSSVANLFPHLPGLPNRSVDEADQPFVYAAYLQRGGGYDQGLFNFSRNYAKANNVSIGNPSLWEAAERGQIFYNNFEVDDVAFFRRRDVARFQDAVTETQPNFFLYRWGDASIRLITLAMFASESQIVHLETLPYKHRCPTAIRVPPSQK